MPSLAEDYLAGLWRSHLPFSLLWQSGKNNTRPSTYVAPTWSWASVIGPTFFDQAQEEDFRTALTEIHILEATTVPEAHVLGPVVEGQLRICAPLCKARLIHSTFMLGRHAYALTFGKYSTFAAFTRIFVDDCRILADHQEGRDVFCLRFNYQAPIPAPPDQQITHFRPVARGLLLELTRQANGQFRRLGVFETSSWPSYLTMFSYLRRSSRLWNLRDAVGYFRGFKDHKIVQAAFQESKIDRQYYNAVDNREGYTVTII